MSLELNCRCDDCRKYLIPDDEIFCSSCYNKLVEEVENLREQIAKLEEQI